MITNTKNLLVELFVEELPPKALKKLGDAFAGVLRDQLVALGLAEAGAVLTSYASPRRLGAHLTNVVAQAADKAVSQKLMPVAVGLDAAGNATPALLKRLGALGADASAVPTLKRALDGKAEALFYESTAKGATLAEGLQKALAEAIAKLPIPKVMSYQLENGELPGWTSVSFVRPAHGLVALHGGDVVPVEALGLTAGRETHGHRFEAKVDPVVLRDASSYALQLEEEGAVIAGFDARRTEIARQLAQAAAKVGGGAKPIDDDALLDEVTALVERPNVLICSFEREFLDVPQECLILTMKANQKYFPLLDAADKLTNQFLVVSNISPDDASAVIGGNERVVRPRLADAKFFFDQDRKKSLASRVESLGKVVYHNKLGTQGERVTRVMHIARTIAEQLGDGTLAAQATQAAQLAKADLVTDMVGEFPELQGTMGRYYALHDGLAVDVADAIEDHYKPRFAGDTLPRGEVGVVVALADKLETLVGMFGIGNLPTGDRDPFALRRHALGVVRMLIEKDLLLDLKALLIGTAAVFQGIDGFDRDRAVVDLEGFILDRLAGSLREQGASAQEVDAVLAPQPQRLGDVPKLLAAVRAFAALPEAPALAAANKRIGNILKKSPEADAHVSPVLLQEPAEKSLHDAMERILPAADAQFEAGDYTASLQTLAALRAPVDAFFDGVMVNAEQLDLRLNRLGLLKLLHGAMNRVALLERLAA
ncbi:glycine--tRNA ligase subunit beta [Variovorax arabinosiphilus]|uniref:glycine--tRNA ligase subunit beta n=1 Tax=Variovorax arabinosiphilus TaxID=3053498 RepID=UPI00257655BA|nr:MULTISPECIES: glycine--tRNA ligase subunit beta [unclassified Variovorax]MDM0120888.1 glycine--tRNA ligase subunit beta [Variovorax sp. J2L1-78]MDM0129949.1 glycine--tRNA ligase subunit beta [Variovorax sp. J2L1-63]MDM0233651.1 glycine--tRNA ligase subunit beta [Variovorax sp. J2R1-6]